MHSPGKGHQELIDILNRYKSGQASEEEKVFVSKYFEYLQQQPDIMDSLRVDEKLLLEEKIWQKLHSETNARPGPLVRPMRYIPQWGKIAVAASLLTIIAVAGYFWRASQTPAGPPESAIQRVLAHDKAPGGDMAILTLADGSTIVLDSTKNGTLVRQGNTRITSLPGGGLSYQAETENPNNTLYNTLTTPRGGQHKIILSDGTAVWLNSASSITYPTAFTGKERKVMITGEAYFEVAKMQEMPFKVNAGKMEVEVLGTHFNVMAYDDEPVIRTTLLEGAVKLTAGSEQRWMKPGQQVDVSSQGNMHDLPDADPESAVAWKNGMFRFNGTDIRTIMRQIARWYDMEIEYSSDPGAVEFSGIVSRKEYVSQLLKILEATGSVHFIVEGKKIRVIP